MVVHIPVVRRGAAVALLSAAALLACASVGAPSAAGAGTRFVDPPGGVLPARGTAPATPLVEPLGTGANLIYYGGQVLLRNTTRIVYWEPSGSKVPPRYHALTQQFLSDVAADDGEPSNTFAVPTQYDNASHEYIKYSSTYAGALTDTHPYPAPTSGCETGSGFPHCLTRAQEETELNAFITANGLPRGADNIYALVLPEGVNTCYTNLSWCGPYTAGTENKYCAYHSQFERGGGVITWANMPYADEEDCREFGQSEPNESSADLLINVLSHELNEAITDPSPGSGWTTEEGEIADKCAWKFGPEFGTTSTGQGYDVLINHHPYETQMLWSNAISGCTMNYGAVAPTASFSVSAHPTVKEQVDFNASGSHSNDPGGYIVAYSWNYGDGTPATSSDRHVFAKAGTYNVSLTVTDEAGLTATTTTAVTIAHQATSIVSGAANGYRNIPVRLNARLETNIGNEVEAGVGGEKLAFELDSQECTATTNSVGEASCEITPTEAAGSYHVIISYAGSSVYGPSTVSEPFTLEAAPPKLSLNATDITTSSATLSGVITPNGSEVERCRIWYFRTETEGYEGDEPPYESKGVFNCPSIPTNSVTPVAFNDTATGLYPHFYYEGYIELCVKGGVCTFDDKFENLHAYSFLTLPEVPTVVTGAATEVTQTSVKLNGTVNPNAKWDPVGVPVTACEFEYGPGFGTSVPCEQSPSSLGSENTTVPVSAELSARTPGEAIEYRLVAANSSGSSVGAGETAQLPANPTITFQGLGGSAEVDGEPGTLVTNVETHEVPAGEPPPSGVPIIGELAYEITDVPADGKTTVTLALPPGDPPTAIYKRIKGEYVNISSNPEKAKDIAKINAMEDTVTIELQEGGFGDTSTTKGVIEDPVVPVHEEPPTVTALSPDSGPAAGETKVTITGTELTNTTAVDFTGVPATSFKVNSATSVTATSPAGAGIANVTVTAPGGTSAAGAQAEFTYEGRPVISAVSPAYGLEAGGTGVTVTGLDLAKVTALKFAGASASHLSCGETECTAGAPPGTGSVEVTATSPGGSSPASEAARFGYVPSGPAPAIESVAADTGPAAGGTTAVITGSAFVGVDAVYFGGTPAEELKVTSATTITAIAPPGTSGRVNVAVVTPNGTSPVTKKGRYTYGDPVIAEVQPSRGPLAGGNVVTVLGSGFAPGEGLTKFSFGKVHPTSVDCTSTRICTMTAPAGKKAGVVDVVAAVGKAKSKKGKPEESGEGEGEHFEYTYEAQTGS